MNEQELAADEQALAAKQIAHYNTFYGSEHGRQVLYHLTNLCHQGKDDAEMMARMRLLGLIKENCGYTNETQMAAIRAESSHLQGE